jgi:hypothetical protein
MKLRKPRNTIVSSSIARVVLVAVSLLLGAGATATFAADARPQGGGEHDPDTMFLLCDESVPCVARAVGDFNADGADDLLVVTHPFASHLREGADRPRDIPDGAEVWPAASTHDHEHTDEAQFAVYFGAASWRDGLAREGVVTGWVEVSKDGLVSVTADDADGDGVDDAVFALASFDGNAEVQRVAVLRGRPHWELASDTDVFDTADYRWERRLAGAYGNGGRPPVLDVAFRDMNKDRRVDLVLAADPFPDRVLEFVSDFGLAPPINPSRAGTVGRLFGSHVAIMFGEGAWAQQQTFRPDFTIKGLGTCEHSLGVVADLTGDSITDMVVNECAGNGIPALPRLIQGSRSWPQRIRLSAEPIARVPSGLERLAMQSASPEGGDVPRPSSGCWIRARRPGPPTSTRTEFKT